MLAGNKLRYTLNEDFSVAVRIARQLTGMGTDLWMWRRGKAKKQRARNPRCLRRLCHNDVGFFCKWLSLICLATYGYAESN